jgi:hypothetical protein
MAENKNSFILYCDLIHTVEQMPDDKAGLLFKHILRYVNDKNPITDDLIIQLTFEPVKQQLKRDLKAWENERLQRSEAGKKGMERRWNKQNAENDENKSITAHNTVITKDNTVINAITKITDTVNVTVTDTVNDNINKIEISEQIKNLNLWLKENAPLVLKMKEQMTDQQLTELKKKYSIDKITSILFKMHNWKDLSKKNVSVYLTASNWLNRESETEKTNRN